MFLDCITVFGKNKTDKLQLNLSVFGAIKQQLTNHNAPFLKILYMQKNIQENVQIVVYAIFLKKY